ncbi:MAG TPA: zf-HC2 domain-containing protein [Planctomycetota bacterium]|nr:zf-HC2 domain-containing protein [Planctomycetota bacterium]
MKCHEAKRHLDLFMDGELSVPENLKVLEHLNLCHPCADVYEGEKALRALLRARVGSGIAPAGLVDRLLAEEAPAASAVAVFPRRRWMSAAAAAGFFLVMLALVFSAKDNPVAFAYEMAVKHQKTHGGFCGVHQDDSLCVCIHCSSEPDHAVCSFFRTRIGHEVGTQDLTDLGYSMIGAQVWERQGSKVCWTVYHDTAGNTISYGLVPTKLAKEPGPLLVCDGVERPVVMIPAGGGMTSVFVFDSETEAQRFRDARNLK